MCDSHKKAELIQRLEARQKKYELRGIREFTEYNGLDYGLDSNIIALLRKEGEETMCDSHKREEVLKQEIARIIRSHSSPGRVGQGDIHGGQSSIIIYDPYMPHITESIVRLFKPRLEDQ